MMKKKILILLFAMSLAFSQTSRASEIKPTAEINRMYYNLSRTKLHKFTCEVSLDLLEKFKNRIYTYLNENDKAEADSAKMYFTYQDNKRTFDIPHYPQLSDERLRQAFVEVMNGTEKIVTGFFSSWIGFVASQFLNEDEEYSFAENQIGLATTYKQGEGVAELLFDKNYVLQKMNFNSEKMSFIIIPKYESTDDGLLITEINFQLKNGSLKELTKIKYRKIDDIYFPETASMKIITNTYLRNDEQNVSLSFFDYKIE